MCVPYPYERILIVFLCCWIFLQMLILSHRLLCILARKFAILQAMRYVVIFICLVVFPCKIKWFSSVEKVCKFFIFKWLFSHIFYRNYETNCLILYHFSCHWYYFTILLNLLIAIETQIITYILLPFKLWFIFHVALALLNWLGRC